MARLLVLTTAAMLASVNAFIPATPLSRTPSMSRSRGVAHASLEELEAKLAAKALDAKAALTSAPVPKMKGPAPAAKPQSSGFSLFGSKPPVAKSPVDKVEAQVKKAVAAVEKVAPEVKKAVQTKAADVAPSKPVASVQVPSLPSIPPPSGDLSSVGVVGGGLLALAAGATALVNGLTAKGRAIAEAERKAAIEAAAAREYARLQAKKNIRKLTPGPSDAVRLGVAAAALVGSAGVFGVAALLPKAEEPVAVVQQIKKQAPAAANAAVQKTVAAAPKFSSSAPAVTPAVAPPAPKLEATVTPAAAPPKVEASVTPAVAPAAPTPPAPTPAAFASEPKAEVIPVVAPTSESKAEVTPVATPTPGGEASDFNKIVGTNEKKLDGGIKDEIIKSSEKVEKNKVEEQSAAKDTDETVKAIQGEESQRRKKERDTFDLGKTKEKVGKQVDKVKPEGDTFDLKKTKDKFGKQVDKIKPEGDTFDLKKTKDKFGKQVDKIKPEGDTFDLKKTKDKFGKQVDKIKPVVAEPAKDALATLNADAPASAKILPPEGGVDPDFLNSLKGSKKGKKL